MRQFLIVALLGLSFVIGFGAFGLSIWPQLTTPNQKTALLKEVP